MIAYYAHFMGIYNTPQEERDLQIIKQLGWEVINPNVSEIQKEVDDFKKSSDDYDLMFDVVFLSKVKKADIFVFRGLPNGRIPGGVFKELKEAQKLNKIIVELPCGTIGRGMTGEETREYLRDMGER